MAYTFTNPLPQGHTCNFGTLTIGGERMHLSGPIEFHGELLDHELRIPELPQKVSVKFKLCGFPTRPKSKKRRIQKKYDKRIMKKWGWLFAFSPVI